MLYRPNFCCNCGEKIERVEWKLFTSRKYCDLCQSELRYKDIGIKAAGVLGLLLSIAIVSNIFGPPATRQSQLAKAQTSRSLAEKVEPQSNFNTTPAQPKQSQSVADPSGKPTVAPQVADQKPSNRLPEPVYYCGAATKKGTPCSRRVKRPGERCWQHMGMPAMTAGVAGAQK
jgi:hypothetical protein